MSAPLSHLQTGYRRALVYSNFGPPLSTLHLVDAALPSLAAGKLRVAMTLVPVNPSDLIPISGAYAQRIALPAVAGYEGVGRVIEASPEFAHLVGKRVLPLRGEGTWQTLVDCAGVDAVEVPDTISDVIAARAYINPLAAFTMLCIWPVQGKTVLLSGAGSNCADLLGHWAVRQGARKVIGTYRSQKRAPRIRSLGIEPVSQDDFEQVSAIAQTADVTFDALGGPLASQILNLMRNGSTFVSYGLLTGGLITVETTPETSYKRFHLRDHLASSAPNGMAAAFSTIWPLLEGKKWPEASIFPVSRWQEALIESEKPGAQKSLLDFSHSDSYKSRQADVHANCSIR